LAALILAAFSDHPAGRSHLVCGEKAVEARAAAEIDHDLAML
jgi:hypothetical protein